MFQNRNHYAAALAVIAGILLIISGTRGPIGTYEFMLEQLPLFINSEPLLSVARIVVLILVGISLLGGFVVIIGGYLIFKDHATTGKLAIGLGAGVGILWLLLILFSLVTLQDASSVFAQHNLIGWIGIIAAFAARFIAK